MKLLIALLVLLPPQEKTPEESVAALNEAEILKHGFLAMRPLLDQRAANPEKIDALILQVKKAAAIPTGHASWEGVMAARSLTFKGAPVGSFGYEMCYGLEIPVFLDLGLRDDDLKAAISVEMTGVPAWRILNEVCRQAGLDWGFFHGYFVVSTPARLWPEVPAKVIELTADQKTKARALIEQLNSESMDERDAAQESLRKLGKGVVPVLNENVKRSEAEIASRCGALVAHFSKPPWRGMFGKAAVERQKLEGDDAKLRETLKEATFTVKVRNLTMDGFFRIMMPQKSIKFELAPPLRGMTLSIDVANIQGASMVALVAQSFGADYLIRDGKLLIDTKEAIEGRLAGTK